MTTCEECGQKISWGVFNYSVSTFRKALCMECQKKERERTYPPKLAKFINDNL